MGLKEDPVPRQTAVAQGVRPSGLGPNIAVHHLRIPRRSVVAPPDGVADDQFLHECGITLAYP
jgi:hypothetical protein